MGDYNRKESYIGNDTSPVLVDTLASNLDVSTYDIVSSSNRNIDLTPNGTGVVNVTGGANISGDLNINSVAFWGGNDGGYDYGKLTWTGTKAIVRGESGRELSLGANGTQDHIFITTSGNVGIGSNNPHAILDVKPCTDGRIMFVNNSGDPDIVAVNNANSAYANLKLEGSNIQFRISGSERMKLDSSGNVGIGGSPVPSDSQYNTATLHLSQEGNASSTNKGSQIKFTTGTSGHTAGDGGFISYWHDNNFYLNNQEGGQFRFYSGGSEKFNLDSAGAIGLGGANYGTSGQVLTSGGSGAAASWTTISGGGGGGGGGYDWEHISDEHTGGASIGGSGNSGHTGTFSPIDISSYKNIIAIGTDYSTSRTSAMGPWALCTNSAADAGVSLEGYAYHFYWALSTSSASYTGNTKDGFPHAGSSNGQSAPNIMYLELRGLDQTKVFFKTQVSQYYQPMWSMGYGFTTSGSSTWYLDILNNIQAWSIVGSK
jgi:hypothetical protein